MSSITTLRKQANELQEQANRVVPSDGVVLLWIDEGETAEDVPRKREKELGRKLNAEKIIFVSWQWE